MDFVMGFKSVFNSNFSIEFMIALTPFRIQAEQQNLSGKLARVLIFYNLIFRNYKSQVTMLSKLPNSLKKAVFACRFVYLTLGRCSLTKSMLEVSMQLITQKPFQSCQLLPQNAKKVSKMSVRFSHSKSGRFNGLNFTLKLGCGKF